MVTSKPYMYIDIETSLNHCEPWCIATLGEDDETFELHFDTSTLPDPNDFIFVAHYGLGFDFPKLAELYNYHIPPANQIDTILLSKLLDPNVFGGHSLRNLAIIAGDELKGEYPKEAFDWGYTEEMGLYCGQDTLTLRSVHLYLLSKLAEMGYSDDCITLEHEVRRITNQQEKNGILLDFEKASNMYADLSHAQLQITEKLGVVFPPIVTARYGKNGKPLADGVEVFNVGSRQQIARRLEHQGVRWSKKTDNGNIIVDEGTLKPLVNKYPAARDILKYLTLGKRRSQVAGWLSVVDMDTHRIHGRVDTLGAITNRMTHSSPNLAQVEKGEEMRGCFIVPGGHKLVGIDASGLELRMLAHYMQDDDYINEVMNGDIHWTNAIAFGLVPVGTKYSADDPDSKAARDVAKTLIYALLYGAGDEKLGSVVGKGRGRGRSMRDQFEEAVPAYRTLCQKVERMACQGHLPGLDGRRIRVRHKHAALNTLLQGAGAIVMKRALVRGVEILDAACATYWIALQIHDEIQVEAPLDWADAVGKAFVQGIRDAGTYYNMRIKLDGEAKVGDNWASTH